jgi:hypothetical protein
MRETACIYSWFFFELALKAMTEYLNQGNRFFLPRKLRFRDTYLQNLVTVFKMLTNEIIDRVTKDFRQSTLLNSSLAFFLRDSLLLMDRSFVIKQIKQYNDEMRLKIKYVGT